MANNISEDFNNFRFNFFKLFLPHFLFISRGIDSIGVDEGESGRQRGDGREGRLVVPLISPNCQNYYIVIMIAVHRCSDLTAVCAAAHSRRSRQCHSMAEPQKNSIIMVI